MASGEGQAQSVDYGPGLSRETRICEAAYELYEKRGREHGHGLDDSLAAKAAMGGWVPGTQTSADQVALLWKDRVVLHPTRSIWASAKLQPVRPHVRPV